MLTSSLSVLTRNKHNFVVIFSSLEGFQQLVKIVLSIAVYFVGECLFRVKHVDFFK